MMKKKSTTNIERSSLKDYMSILKDMKIPFLWLGLVIAAAVISAYAGSRLALITGDVIDRAGDISAKKLFRYVFSYLLIGAGAALNAVAVNYAAQKMNLQLRDRLWKKIMYTRTGEYDKEGPESLVSRVTTDCDFTSNILTVAVSLVSSVISFVIYTGKLFKLNTVMTLAMLGLIPLSILIGWGYARLRFMVGQKTQTSLARTTTYLVERTKNLNLIKTSNARQEEIENGMACFDEQYKQQLYSGLLTQGYIGLQHLYSIISVCIPFFIGAGLVAEGKIKTGVVIAFYTMGSQLGMTATNIIDEIGSIRSANGALARVINVLRMKEESRDEGMDVEELKDDIKVDLVDFSYGEKHVLDKIACTIPAGKVTALIGTNGSGKSTMFKLLDRLADADAGQIVYNGQKAEDYNVRQWRKRFCLVAQGSPLVEGTIAENICYGVKREVSREEIEEAARKACVMDFVKDLPEGLDTHVALSGSNFSGGQRQCIAIARAIMNDPEILLLDEATSSLDPHKEASVMKGLSELMKDRTSVIIAHSLATIRKADHVIILTGGKVTGTGSPAQILEQTGNYLSKVINRRKAEKA
ncbi:MAG: ABC transporter ATP-binding protein [Lachnospiraceae bacterium]|nr:ABC transporter ATP-binding protein [Lachnospiraceae bacterium]